MIGGQSRSVILEKLSFHTRRYLAEAMIESAANVEIIYQAETRSMVAEMRLAVEARRSDQEYAGETIAVPSRPVRDGLWLVLAEHGGPLSDWFRRRVRWNRHPVVIHHSTYYGCPHINLGETNRHAHLTWLANANGEEPEPD